MTFRLILMTAGLCGLALQSQATDLGVALGAAFHTISKTSVWPVSGSTYDDIISTFGPRLKEPNNTPDFHRAIDISAPAGTSVVAPTPGILWDLTTFTDGGLTLILRHDFPTPVTYMHQTLTHYYTFYEHLLSVPTNLSMAAADNH